jgi:hypothetical protein
MSLRDQMNIDLVEVFLNTDDHAEAGTYLPRGVAPGFTCVVLRSDAPPSLGGEPTHGSSSTVRLLANLVELRAGILAQEGVARDPAEGDRIELGTTTITLQAPELEAADSHAVTLTGTIATLHALTAARRPA